MTWRGLPLLGFLLDPCYRQSTSHRHGPFDGWSNADDRPDASWIGHPSGLYDGLVLNGYNDRRCQFGLFFGRTCALIGCMYFYFFASAFTSSGEGMRRKEPFNLGKARQGRGIKSDGEHDYRKKLGLGRGCLPILYQSRSAEIGGQVAR